MKFSMYFFALAIAEISFCNLVKRTTPTSACFADNCLRGIRGTGSNIKPPLTSRLADCSSFMRATVTPAPITTTITIATVTITVPPMLPRGLEARQQTISPSQVPAYATFCTGSSAYSSACSCNGITKTTLTVATPTVTEYATATTTYVPPACGPGLTLCDGTCKDLDNDNDNCGTCGKVCASGFVCGQSACVLPAIYACDNIFGPCGGSCGGTCFADVNGAGWCKVALQCAGLAPCTTGADCPSTICLVNNCGHVCAGTQYLCPNNLLPRTIFQKREPEGNLVARELVESEIGLVDSSLLGGL
ncbi:hypothetical protein VTL71DRAFT_9373 [Oculimacula yallundae]|uniref:Antifreeze protein n=1 Tax=Oculimacula yallundae TaxID=86028 RepID=A0ABR4BSV1_9HELO